MGKSTNSMAIFNSYVKLPEGKTSGSALVELAEGLCQSTGCFDLLTIKTLAGGFPNFPIYGEFKSTENSAYTQC
jgi:hypothetical protein